MEKIRTDRNTLLHESIQKASIDRMNCSGRRVRLDGTGELLGQ